MDYKTKVGIIIPSLSPDERLVTLVEELRAHGFAHWEFPGCLHGLEVMKRLLKLW